MGGLSKIWIAVLAGGAGVALGIYLTRSAVRSGWQKEIHDGLTKIGLGGGTLEQTVDDLILPRVS